MRIDINENFYSWIERVRQYEMQYAIQQISKGKNINLVLEEMSIRIQKKILHPIILEVKNSIELKTQSK